MTDEQVVDLVIQLTPMRQRAAPLALAAGNGREQRLERAEAQLRRVCTERGLGWDQLSEDEREAFIDGLVHEDRPCGR